MLSTVEQVRSLKMKKQIGLLYFHFYSNYTYNYKAMTELHLYVQVDFGILIKSHVGFHIFVLFFNVIIKIKALNCDSS